MQARSQLQYHGRPGRQPYQKQLSPSSPRRSGFDRSYRQSYSGGEGDKLNHRWLFTLPGHPVRARSEPPTDG